MPAFMRRMSRPAADIFTASMAEIFQQLISPIPGSRLLRGDGACAMVTGIPAPPVNGVWTERSDPSLAHLAALLDEVAGTGVPYGLRLRSVSDEAVAAVTVVGQNGRPSGSHQGSGSYGSSSKSSGSNDSGSCTATAAASCRCDTSAACAYSSRRHPTRMPSPSWLLASLGAASGATPARGRPGTGTTITPGTQGVAARA
jgi:hypothetical protein